jgi:small subunit ribosomal protein S15
MKMNKEKKVEIIKKFGSSESDTGSSAVQVALLSKKISEMTEHLKVNKKDKSSMRGLIAMVNKRRKLLNYLKRKDLAAYNSITEELKIRKK